MPWVLALLYAPALYAETASTAPAAEELTQLLKYFLDGASWIDVAVHDRFWADDLIYTRSADVRIGKAEILANATSGPTATAEGQTDYSAEDIHIQQYGDTAVVAFRLVGATGSGDQANISQYLNTGTFAKRSGEWRAVAWQSARVPEAKKEAAINLTPGAVSIRCALDERTSECALTQPLELISTSLTKNECSPTRLRFSFSLACTASS